MALQLVDSNHSGVFNVVSSERLSKYEFGIKLATCFGLDAKLINKISINLKSVERVILLCNKDEIPKNLNISLITGKSDYKEKKDILNSNLKPYYKSRRFIAKHGYSEVVTWSFMDKLKASIIAVSYTHLTLPTNREV